MRPRCPICGSRKRREFGGRPDAVCAGCGALERHRALAADYLRELADGRGLACLEIGPLNQRVFGDYLRRRGWEYVSVDRWRTGNPHDPRNVAFVTHELDLTDLAPLKSDAFALAIAQHVIEEIPDYQKALDELARVLSATGTALLEIPFDPDRPTSERHPPDGYGNVWEFGADLVTEIERRFEQVDVAGVIAARRPVSTGG